MAEIHSPLALSVFDKLVNKDATKNINDAIPTAPQDAIDLIEKCLKFRPSKRLTAYQALDHPFVKRFHLEDKAKKTTHDEDPCTRKLTMPIDDNTKFETKWYKE